MKYEERTRKLGSWLVKILKRYSPPATMDDETLREEMDLIVKDINKNIPSQFEDVDFDQTLGKIDGHFHNSNQRSGERILQSYYSSEGNIDHDK